MSVKKVVLVISTDIRQQKIKNILESEFEVYFASNYEEVLNYFKQRSIFIHVIITEAVIIVNAAESKERHCFDLISEIKLLSEHTKVIIIADTPDFNDLRTAFKKKLASDYLGGLCDDSFTDKLLESVRSAVTALDQTRKKII